MKLEAVLFGVMRAVLFGVMRAVMINCKLTWLGLIIFVNDMPDVVNSMLLMIPNYIKLAIASVHYI